MVLMMKIQQISKYILI